MTEDKNKGLSRRQFIKKSVGTMGIIGVALVAPSMSVFTRLRTSDSPAKAAEAEAKVRAWCMVIDLKKCDGCTGLGTPPQCTQACTLGHFVPKGQQWIQVFQVDLPGGGTYFMPTPCFHCENAPCVNVCPVGATYHGKNGVVLIDHHRCIGCRMCMAACPYQRRFFVWGTPELPPGADFGKYTPEKNNQAIKGTTVKCDFCPEMMRDGRLPYCVSACPRKVLYMGDLVEDLASNGVEVVKLSRFLDENDAYRYKEELGTQPRVWYLPGHGQLVGRKPDDPRELMPLVWPWGEKGWDRQYSLWPWGEPDIWGWEAQPK